MKSLISLLPNSIDDLCNPEEGKEGVKREVLSLINCIRAETQPIDGHDDPGALIDCWEMLIDGVEKLTTEPCEHCGDVNCHATLHG